MRPKRKKKLLISFQPRSILPPIQAHISQQSLRRSHSGPCRAGNDANNTSLHKQHLRSVRSNHQYSDPRLVASAPSHGLSLPKPYNTLILPRLNKSEHAGLTTKEKSSQSTNSKKFASSWATTRAELQYLNLRDSNASPEGILPRNKQSHIDADTPKERHFHRDNIPACDVGTNDNRVVHKIGGRHGAGNDASMDSNMHHQIKDGHRKVSKIVGAKWSDPHHLSMDPHRTDRNIVRRGSSDDTDINKKHFHPQINDQIDVAQTYLQDNIYGSAVNTRHHQKHKGVTDNVDGSASVHSDKDSNKPHTLTKRESQMYIHIKDVYGSKEFLHHRESKFFEKLEAVQQEHVFRSNDKYLQHLKEKDVRKQRQQKELSDINKRYEKSQAKRFRTQHVSCRVFDNDDSNKESYVLPAVNGSSGADKNKQDTSFKVFDRDKQRNKNWNKFHHIFKACKTLQLIPRTKTPKMDGIDTVLLQEKGEDGKKKATKQDVTSIINDAKDLIDIDNRDDVDDPATPIHLGADTGYIADNSDSEEEDIFEKARKKYGLDFDIDDGS